jgi:hypothetical protein
MRADGGQKISFIKTFSVVTDDDALTHAYKFMRNSSVFVTRQEFELQYEKRSDQDAQKIMGNGVFIPH